MNLELFSFLLLGGALWATGCTDRKGTAVQDVEYVVDLQATPSENPFLKDSAPNHWRLVALETTQECLLGGYSQNVDFFESYIFIQPYTGGSNSIFVFDTTGRFLNKIAQMGRGPKEHQSIGSFYIDREHRFVGVYDVLKKQIFRYAFDGTLLAQKPVPPEMNYIRDLIKVSEDQLIATFSNSAECPFNYGVFDPEEYTFLHYAIPYTVIGTESSTNWMPSIARNDHSYLAATALSDTLYSGASQTPEVLLQTGRKATSPAQIATWGPFARGLEAWNEALKRGYSGGVTQLWMTEKYGCLRTDQFAHTASFSLNGVEQELTGTYPCYLIWALRESDHPSVSFIPRSINLFYPGMSPFVGATEDALVGIIPAYRIAGLRETELPSEDQIYLYPPIKHLIETIQEDDNPVLVFYPISAL